MKIVTICGSLKYQKEMMIEAEKLALKGYCVLTPVFSVSDNIEITKEQISKMKEAHFKKIDRYVSKDDVLQELNKEFQKKGLGDYTKNDTTIFEKVTSEGKVDTAIKNCKYMEELNKDGQPSQRNPMTKVYKIVEGLKEYLE